MFRGDDRGVSEVLGFVLVFSLIVASVGIVVTAGLGGLQDMRDGERVTNGERALDVLAENYDDVLTGAPSRSTQIRLSDASLRVGDPVAFRVDNGTGTLNRSEETSRISFVVGDEAVHFVNGAVIRESPGGAVMLREPTGVLDAETMVVHQTEFYTRGVPAVVGGGDRTVQVRLYRRGQPGVSVDPDSTTVIHNVTTDADTIGAWRRHYGSRDGVICNTTENVDGADRDRLSCEFTTVEELRIVSHDVALAIE
ncbi:hypothetical protein SAMN05192561_10679 [Halopenitus malekzadehii]|uniref:Uncharacterized protein n=1 Tax=Halopenitus malekzadehii TaxID=1267564 RepID=A0A1H6J556_9EURY|nr:hypothetical protein [Halopenitus malekzadehii]SEH55389.1 hypothetical protein SAMN05192561_10679 [Halopenitus malekzadehii]